jgi:hypothetical protein
MLRGVRLHEFGPCRRAPRGVYLMCRHSRMPATAGPSAGSGRQNHSRANDHGQGQQAARQPRGQEAEGRQEGRSGKLDLPQTSGRRSKARRKVAVKIAGAARMKGQVRVGDRCARTRSGPTDIRLRAAFHPKRPLASKATCDARSRYIDLNQPAGIPSRQCIEAMWATTEVWHRRAPSVAIMSPERLAVSEVLSRSWQHCCRQASAHRLL